jgi:hypothetical protein
MAADAQLIVRDKIETFAIDVYHATRRYPKAERHVLAAETRSALYRLLRYAITAAKVRNKAGPLNAADAEVAMLNAYLRIGMQLKYLPFPAYERLVKQLDEIGRIIGGWLKRISNNG